MFSTYIIHWRTILLAIIARLVLSCDDDNNNRVEYDLPGPSWQSVAMQTIFLLMHAWFNEIHFISTFTQHSRRKNLQVFFFKWNFKMWMMIRSASTSERNRWRKWEWIRSKLKTFAIVNAFIFPYGAAELSIYTTAKKKKKIDIDKINLHLICFFVCFVAAAFHSFKHFHFRMPSNILLYLWMFSFEWGAAGVFVLKKMIS